MVEEQHLPVSISNSIAMQKTGYNASLCFQGCSTTSDYRVTADPDGPAISSSWYDAIGLSLSKPTS